MGDQHREELLERLWYLLESGRIAVDEITQSNSGSLSIGESEELQSCGWIAYSEDGGTVSLTEKGQEMGERLMRAHRLAERLLYDVLGARGEAMEFGACEFEHIVASDLLDSVCTLLGHPRECPHGLPIPEGNCCRESVRSIESQASTLSDLGVGAKGRVAYVSCKNDSQLHKFESLQLRPGAEVIMHQTYPSFVVECEGAKIAMEKRLADSIFVWKANGSHSEH